MASEALSVGEATTLARRRLAQRSETASLDGEVLLASILEKSRAWVLAHPEGKLTSEASRLYLHKLEELAAGKPLPYLTGVQEFFGLSFQVTPQVLIPRPETELLVERALAWLSARPGRRSVADVGTGSGCIAAALAVHVPDLTVFATDISTPALEVARGNLERLGVLERVRLLHTHLLRGSPGPFDLICANLPYIPTGTLASLTDLRFEPREALDGGLDGLDLVRDLFQQARSLLAEDGLLLAEIEAGQGVEARRAAVQCFPGKTVQIIKDLAGKDRLVEIGGVG